MKEKLDLNWHKSRIAARIWLKALRRPLNARDRRLARRFSDDRGVTDRLIQQGVLWFLGGPNRTVQTPSGPKPLLGILGCSTELRHAMG